MDQNSGKCNRQRLFRTCLLVILTEHKRTHEWALEEAGGGGHLERPASLVGAWKHVQGPLRDLSCGVKETMAEEAPVLFQCPFPCRPKEIAWRWCMNASLHQHITNNNTAIHCEGKRTFRLLFVFNNKMMHFSIESCHLGQLVFSVLCLGR